jgi:hypothetical protein
MVNTEPAKVRAVYESKTFSLELMFMHAMKKNVIITATVCLLGDTVS